jgi:hypothetical protein
MAEQNPIKYSDLISPDDSIEKLIGQLEQLNEAYTGMANSVKTQAAQVAASLKSVSGATAQGQQTTRNAAAETDKLRKAYEQLNFARSDTARKIKELEMAKQQENRITKLQILLNNSEEGSYAHLSAQYALNKMQLNQLTAAERANIPHAKKLEEETKRIYEEMKRLQEATGKFSLNVGNYANSITQAIGVNTRWFSALQELATLTEGGLTNGLKMAGKAVGAFGKQMLALLMNPIVAIVAGITAAFMALAHGIKTSEENSWALERVMAPLGRGMTSLTKITQNMAENLLRQVEGYEMLAIVFSKMLERLPLVGAAFEKVNKALMENIELTQRKQRLEREERSNTVEQAKLQRDVAMFRNLAATTKDATTKEMALKMARRAEQKIMENEIKLAKEDLAIKKQLAEQAGNDKETNDALAAAQARLYRAEENYYQKTLRINKQLSNMEKGGGGSAGGRTTSSKVTANTEIDTAKQALEERRKIEDAKIALVEDANLRERMTIIVSYNRKIEDLKGSEEYVTQMKLLYEQQREQKLAQLFEKEADEQKRREEKDLNERLKATDKLVEQHKKELEAQNQKKGKQDIYDLLGFSLDDEQKNALDDAFAYAMDHLSQYLAAWEQVAARKAQLAEEEVSRTKRLLDSEIEARNNGYAANVALAQKEYENAKKNQEKALQEQRRAQRAQEAMQTISQASNLVTASTLIWSQLGFPWALPAIAVMWGSFAAAKIKAMELTSGSEEYGEGTVELLQGGSHQSGNDIDLGRKKDGTRRRAEGGEYFAVINKRNSRRYRDIIPGVINALNDGTFAQKYQRAYDDGGVSVSVQAQSPDIRELSNDVRLIRQQGEQGSTFDANGNEIVRYKNLRRIIKSK